MVSSWAAPLAKPAGRRGAPQRQQSAIDGGGHACTPSHCNAGLWLSNSARVRPSFCSSKNALPVMRASWSTHTRNPFARATVRSFCSASWGTNGAAIYSTPSTRRSSDTGHARRPLMRMGRIGPSSRQAQMRSVCCARLRCPAASLVGSAARVSCASGVSSWCAIVESLSGLLRWLYWLAATPAARNMQPLANCEKPYFMRVAARFMQPLQPLSF